MIPEFLRGWDFGGVTKGSVFRFLNSRQMFHASRHLHALFKFGYSRRDSGSGAVQVAPDVADPSLPHKIEHSQTLEEFFCSGDIFHLV
jgi:hypothetical protein